MAIQGQSLDWDVRNYEMQDGGYRFISNIDQ